MKKYELIYQEFSCVIADLDHLDVLLRAEADLPITSGFHLEDQFFLKGIL